MKRLVITALLTTAAMFAQATPPAGPTGAKGTADTKTTTKKKHKKSKKSADKPAASQLNAPAKQ